MRSKVRTDIARGVNFDDPTELPTDLLHLMSRNTVVPGPHGHNISLKPHVQAAIADELKFREEGGKKGWQHGGKASGVGTGASGRTIRLKGLTPPPAPGGPSSDGLLSMYAWVHHKAIEGDFPKTSNPYDIRTWNQTRLDRYDRRAGHKEATFIEKESDFGRYKEDKKKGDTKKWRPWLLRHADHDRIESEKMRRGLIAKSSERKVRVKRGSEKDFTNVRYTKPAQAPAGFESHLAHRTPRGISPGNAVPKDRAIPKPLNQSPP